jgi:PAS domain S-box-containing protein
MERKLRSYLLSMILLGAVIDVVLVAGLYFLLWKTVLQPLREIEGYATSRSRGGREAAAWDVRHYRGELESLRHALEAMIGQLDARHAELQSASARLEAEKTKLQTLFSILPTGISITDEQRNVLQMNPALERLLGFSLEEIIGGRHGLRTYHNQDGGTILADDMPSARAMREQGPVLDQQIMISKEDGSSLWVSVSAAPLPGYGAAVTTTDITDRKLAEQHLIQQLEELQRWQKVTLGREERVRQLKAEINELCRRTGLSPRYRSQTDTSSSAPDSQGRGA